ncbi:hypothetical protein NW755_012772 [Fusarium falciforme]|uniref:Methyltransferase domain-containing protein n=1 Tax=Fusarium falciforme TaxID=195108 RepID=A0A9W8QV95_9HYPO|nr:hypothetical protein NW755_012772 [Fusarium falciforme]
MESQEIYNQVIRRYGSMIKSNTGHYEQTVAKAFGNCVINLVPAGDKQLEFNEMFLLLKPGGRVAISDILARKELTDEMKEDMARYVGCISGASQVSEYDSFLRKAGFEDILIMDSNRDLNVYWSAADGEPPCCGTDTSKTQDELLYCYRQDLKHDSYTEHESCPQDQPSLIADEASRLAYQLSITDFNE